MRNKILVIVAHPDDEVLGVGGTILKHVAEGDDVSALILGDGELSRGNATLADIKKREKQAEQVSKKMGLKNLFLEKLPDNQFDSVSLLSITKIVEKYINKIKPEVIYTHHGGDLNIDHQLTFQSVLTACRPQPGFFVKSIFTFETPSSTEWANKDFGKTFIPNFYNNISDFIDRKIEILRIYKDEMRSYPHPRSYEGVQILAKFRGMTVGYKYAEAFEVIRKLND
ncbi:MAG: PIG-L family deacetylase [Candidatus Paceibacterota bacterium]|jgi:LmbE family N-acetylglucosaminyl deacetylase